jgi:hypothetical protein
MIVLLLYCLFSSFTAERITFDSDADWIPTIAVDESCYVHIVNTYGGQIRYITNRSGSWVIDSIMIDGNSPSIDVTPAGTPHIAFEADCGGDDDIYYATRVDTVWDIDTVINNTVISSDPSLALSSDSIPHITYYDFEGGLSIRHAEKVGGIWSNEVIPGSSIGTYSSISIDGSNHLHIAFVTGTYGGNREITYANDTAGSWVFEDITNDALDDDFPTIAVDKNGNVHIVFAKDDGADWELWYATNETGVFVTEQLTDNVGINECGYPSIAVDNNCGVHLAYQENNVAGDIFYLSNMTGSWQQDTIFTAPWNKTLAWVDRSIALDNLGFIHACLANQESGAFTQEIYHAISDSPVGVSEKTERKFPTRDIKLKVHPNPFRESVEIQVWNVSVYRSIGESEIQIYDISGRRVREISLLPFNFSLGVTWDGADDDGVMVTPGVYFLKLNVGEYTIKQKLIKVR